jgi:four helix bundle protein
MNDGGYKNSAAWKKAMGLVVLIYEVTEQLPSNEKYGLISQMRRAAVSIPSNIAEGYRRSHGKEFVQFLRIAFGSASELETQMEICKILPIYKHLNLEKVEATLNEVLKILNSSIRTLST